MTIFRQSDSATKLNVQRSSAHAVNAN